MLSGARVIRSAVKTGGAIVNAPRLFSTGRSAVGIASTVRMLGKSGRGIPASTASFSTSVRRMDVSGELVNKIDSEIEFELTATGDRDSASYVDQFRAIGFELEDVAGQEEVVLTRDYNGESIKITFSVADIHNAETGNQFGEEADHALFDEDYDPKKQSESDSDKQIVPDHVNMTEDQLENVQFFCRINVEVKKPGQDGSLHFSALAEDGEIIVESMPFYPTGQVSAAEEDQQYIGPPFSNLDADLQMLVSRYLEERGIGTELALLVPEYVDWKEQREYISWLRNIKQFVSA